MGILKKIKKGLKKVAKPAAAIGAAYLASKALKNRKENNAFLETEGDNKSDMRDYGPFTKAARTMPTTEPAKFKYPQIAYGQQVMAKGGRAGKKSKPKSIGKALRGGGKVMR